MNLDELDVRIIELLTDDPRVNGVDAAATLSIARATYQTRLDRLVSTGAISLAPTVRAASAGFVVAAFINVEIRQNSRGRGIIEHLSAIPEVVEVHTVTGASDLLVRVVAQSNDGLQTVLDRIADHEYVLHTATSIALQNQIPLRTSQLARHALKADEQS